MILYHGTTVPRAQAICLEQKLAALKTFLVSRDNIDLAKWFAHRAASKERAASAVVKLEVEDEAIDFMRRNGLMKLTKFSEGDNPKLTGRNQWVIEAGAVDYLNRALVESSWEFA
jgi:hypothetical protein